MTVLMAKLLMTDLLFFLAITLPYGCARSKVDSPPFLLDLFALVPAFCAPILAIALGVCLIWGIK